MSKVLIAAMLSVALGSLPLLAQEKKGMPMKESMPTKGEGMQGGV